MVQKPESFERISAGQPITGSFGRQFSGHVAVIDDKMSSKTKGGRAKTEKLRTKMLIMRYRDNQVRSLPLKLIFGHVEGGCVQSIRDEVGRDAKVDEEVSRFPFADALLQRKPVNEVDVGPEKRRIRLQKQINHRWKEVVGRGGFTT